MGESIMGWKSLPKLLVLAVRILAIVMVVAYVFALEIAPEPAMQIPWLEGLTSFLKGRALYQFLGDAGMLGVFAVIGAFAFKLSCICGADRVVESSREVAAPRR